MANADRRSSFSIKDVNIIPKPASVHAICPYKVKYFDCTAADARFFYGRTALTDQLLEKVRSGNFLAVLGASGSGKSSVVRAGLLYQLMLGRRLSGSEAWHIRIFRPGERPLQNLALAFVGAPTRLETIGVGAPTRPEINLWANRETRLKTTENAETAAQMSAESSLEEFGYETGNLFPGGRVALSEIEIASQIAKAEELLERGADGLQRGVGEGAGE